MDFDRVFKNAVTDGSQTDIEEEVRYLGGKPSVTLFAKMTGKGIPIFVAGKDSSKTILNAFGLTSGTFEVVAGLVTCSVELVNALAVMSTSETYVPFRALSVLKSFVAHTQVAVELNVNFIKAAVSLVKPKVSAKLASEKEFFSAISGATNELKAAGITVDPNRIVKKK